MTNQYSYAEDFAASVKKPVKKQADPNISSAARVYMISRMNKENAASGYRSGEFRGNKYMTSEDFVTYFNSRGKVNYAPGTRKTVSEENAGEILRSRITNESRNVKSSPVKNAPNVSAAVRIRKEENARTVSDERDVKIYNPTKKARNTSCDNAATGVFNRVSNDKIKKIRAIANDWLPEEKIVDVKVKRSPKRFAKIAAAVSGIAISLMMIVGGSVMVSDAGREAKELENELKELEITRNELSLQLDMKNDINVLREKATNELGMIRKEYVDALYLDVSGHDSIEAFENENDKNVGISAILSAFGIG